MPSNRPRVLVAIPERLFLDATCWVLPVKYDIEVVGGATNRRDAVEIALTSKPDVALLDDRFASEDQPRLMQVLLERGIGAVILCRGCIDGIAQTALANPAVLLLSYNESFDDVVATIRSVAEQRLTRATADDPRR